MRWLAGMALVLAALPGSAAVAAAAGCRELPPLTSRVEAVVEPAEKPAIKPSPAEAIAREARRSGKSPADPRALTRGLTLSEVHGQARYELREAKLPNGGRCVAFGTVSARFSVAKAVILVDQRYRPGSCERSAILDHEREHVRITADTLEQWEGRLHKRLEGAATAWRGRWLPASEQRRIEARIKGVISDLVRDIQADADRKHAEIDTPASYEEVRRRCRHW